MTLLAKLPKVRGQYREGADLAKTAWFQVGGAAEVLYKPADLEDLQHFLKEKPADVPVITLGACSNIIIRDGGISGVVIKLGRAFADITWENGLINAGAAALDVHVATIALQNSLTGLEFLSGIPGTMGGALAMNAGAYGAEIKDVLVKAEGVDGQGNVLHFSLEDMGFGYRKCSVPSDVIFTRAWLKASAGDVKAISARMEEIKRSREETQPVRTRTGGSTFANPSPDKKAWQLIDEAGLRGLQRGGAKVSDKHCNFLENVGGATAADIEGLGDEVREKVKANSGIELRWEIKRIGNFRE